MELIITPSPPHRRARPASGLYTGFSVLLAPPTPPPRGAPGRACVPLGQHTQHKAKLTAGAG